MNPDYKNLTKIPYFRRAVLQNFPFIEEDFDALTDYGLLCKVVKYLNKVIEQQNLVNDNTNALYQSYIQLKNFVDNYFDNLDVQEEINNKLDAMAQDGTLQEIISDYLNSKAIFGFDNVNSMKNATNLINGSYAETLGFYQKNDGGGSLYKIRTITNDDVVDNIFIIELNDNTLIAELIINDINNIKTFGVYGDGVHDDLVNIQYAINKLPLKTIYFPKGTYAISNKIVIKNANNKTVNLKFDNNAIIKNYNNIYIDTLLEIGKDETDGQYQRYNIYSKYLIMNVEGGIFDCTNVRKGIISNSNRQYVKFDNITFTNINDYGLYLEKGERYSSGDNKVSNCNFFNYNSKQGTAIYVQSNDNEIQHCRVDGMKIAIDIYGGTTFIHDTHCTALYDPIMTENDYNDTICFNINNSQVKFTQCYADTYATAFKINVLTTCDIIDCTMYNYDAFTDDNVTQAIWINTTEAARIHIANSSLFSTYHSQHKFFRFKFSSSYNFAIDDNNIKLTNNYYRNNGNVSYNDLAYSLYLNNMKGITPYYNGRSFIANKYYYLGSFTIKNEHFYNQLKIRNKKQFEATIQINSASSMSVISSNNSFSTNWKFAITAGELLTFDNGSTSQIYNLYVQVSNDALLNNVNTTIEPLTYNELFFSYRKLITEGIDIDDSDILASVTVSQTNV